MNPKVTIITPSYNQAQFIEQSIESVLSQNYPYLEYIIIDGGSKDGSVEIIRKYKKHLAYWISEPDHGQSHAINKGLQRTKGDIVNWLNSDDYYEPDTLRKVGEVFDDPDIHCYCGRSRLFDQNDTVRFSKGTDIYHDNLAKTIGWARTDQPETWFRKSIWDRVGLLSNDLHYSMDREWWIRYLFAYGLDGIKQTDDILVNFRLHEHSKTKSQNQKFQEDHDAIYYSIAVNYNFQEIANLISQYCNINPKYYFSGHISGNNKLVETSLLYYLIQRADQFYFQSNYNFARSFLRKVNPKLIDVQDQKLFRNLSLKLKFPSKILDLMR